MSVNQSIDPVVKLAKQTTLSPELQHAIAWLKSNPDMQGLSLRKAAESCGVSYSTINRAKEYLK
jgi:DNA-binding MurR/RpiR family transcriptional regulator